MSDDAQETTKEMKRLLKIQGWCFLTCLFLDNEVIALVRDTPPLREFEREQLETAAAKIKESLPDGSKGVVCYTLPEFEVLCDNPSPRLIHEAKKLGATIETKEKEEDG